jgi:hypothetical protein
MLVMDKQNERAKLAADVVVQRYITIAAEPVCVAILRPGGRPCVVCFIAGNYLQAWIGHPLRAEKSPE